MPAVESLEWLKNQEEEAVFPFLVDFVFAFFVALVLTAIFAGALRRQRFGAVLIFFFVVLLFGTWAGGVWITPVGPPLWGVSWLSFVLVGLFFALILTALLPPERERKRPESVSELDGGTTSLVVFNAFFWVLVVGLFIVIITSYLI
jgi:hypothetical protein